MSDQPADERSPLLTRTEEDARAVREEEGAIATEETEAAPSPEKKRTWWQFGWTVVWSALAIFVAVVFVKGFIDADDVEVCTSFILLCLWCGKLSVFMTDARMLSV